MSTHIVFAVPCLWQGGTHSLQGLPSILLIKQWLCTQPIQGRENATQRDKNIKHSAIWGGRVPNNDSLVIMEALFFFSPVTPLKNSGWRRNMWVLISPCVSVSLVSFFFSCVKKKRGDVKFQTWREKRLPIQRRWLIWTPPPPPKRTHPQRTSMQFIFHLFCHHQGQCCSWPHKGLSLRLKSSPHKILFEINSVTFTMQRQHIVQSHPRYPVKQVLHIFINQSCVSGIEEFKTSLWCFCFVFFFTFNRCGNRSFLSKYWVCASD